MAESKNFENSLKRLEEIALEMEKNETTLENSLELYREGVLEAKFCSKTLKDVEQEVFVLRKDIEGILKLEDFNDVYYLGED